MKKVFQTKFNGEGNCFAACIASLLECKLEDVPQLGKDEEWQVYADRIRPWLQENYSLLLYWDEFERIQEIFKGTDSYYIGSGMSSRGFEHAVIFKEEQIVHDPHPSREGISDRMNGFYFLKLHY